MNYTLVLYKSDGCNTCKCCVMESWGSDFSFDTNVTEEDAVHRIAEAFTKPRDGGSYEAHLIGVRNGEQIVHQFEQYSDWRSDSCGSVSTRSQLEDYEIDDEEGRRIDKLIRDKVSSILEDRAAKKKKASDEEKAKRKQEQELSERQQLAALQQKYNINQK